MSNYIYKPEYEDALEVVKKYKGQWQLPEKANAELNQALKIIKHYQDGCYHSYEKYTGLITIERICKYCGLKDPDFDPYEKD